MILQAKFDSCLGQFSIILFLVLLADLKLQNFQSTIVADTLKQIVKVIAIWFLKIASLQLNRILSKSKE